MHFSPLMYSPEEKIKYGTNLAYLLWVLRASFDGPEDDNPRLIFFTLSELKEVSGYAKLYPLRRALLKLEARGALEIIKREDMPTNRKDYGDGRVGCDRYVTYYVLLKVGMIY